MKKPSKTIPDNFTRDKNMAARYAPVHDMVTALLAKTDPEAYPRLLAELCAEWQPVGREAEVVAAMAGLACRIRGCSCLEAEILKGNMQVPAAPRDTPEVALARAYLRDCLGPNLLDKLSRYESWLSREFSRCLRIMTSRLKSRESSEAAMADALARREPCTSVIQ